MKKLHLVFSLIIIVTSFPFLSQAQVIGQHTASTGLDVFSLSNNMVTQKVVVRNNILQEDDLIGNDNWLAKYHNKNHGVYTDGNYALKIMWTGWSAPGKEFNGDLQITITKKDYKYVRYNFRDMDNGGKELDLFFTPFNPENSIQLKLTYQLLPGKFYAKRKISLQDTTLQTQWLEKFISRDGIIDASAPDNGNSAYLMREENGANYQQVQNISSHQKETTHIIKRGAFGQPCAADFANGGVFLGVEYPAADNNITRDNNNALHLSCSELIGTVIKNNWVESKWVVEGLAPDHFVKDWFFNYLPDIRVAPNKPYALYNSWYDLRSPEYPGVKPDHVMNEKNILHIIDLFKKNMIDKYGIHLNAFVLDDGWDDYDSDWKMRTTTFPHGIKPIVDALKPLGTTLGIWFGPTGGYSFRMRRINWMKAHGYETVGHGRNYEMMDIAGPKYSALFEKRTTDFVKQGMGYFKWDGIQFSSSNPDNGHAVGYHSRRAVLESMIEKCKAVRAINPDVFLNITSGTWMSPWWMQYANQIWMQGADYGYADVPSVNERDAAVTYKDFVLYDDFHNQDVWFPVSNLMTHGIIKGNLESVGGNDDPLDKFTDDIMFYFGRGVTMYEMYISPDLLKPQEWSALSKSLAWAKDHFDIMNKTYMIGGDPTKGETYGYVHFKSDSGIIALRNPSIATQPITFALSPALGMADSANSLVLERVYPTHWISPELYAAGATITLPLDGFEAAVYEIYPLQNATKPLLSDAEYEVTKIDDQHYDLHILQAGKNIKLLNPGMIKNISVDGNQTSINNIVLRENNEAAPFKNDHTAFNGNNISSSLQLDAQTVTARYIIMLQPDTSFKGKSFPDIIMKADGKEIKPTRQMQNGSWACYSVVVNNSGSHNFQLQLQATDKVKNWKGKAQVWITGQQKQQRNNIEIITNKNIVKAPMPPSPYVTGALKFTKLIGEGDLSL